jgi:prepilin-type N-terminal cleavage/methylation domain-containing protein
MTRRGFTVMEMAIALMVLGVAGGIVASLAIWAIQQRMNLDDRARALNLAENAFETANLQPWSELEAWSKSAILPESVLARWPAATVTVIVEPGHGLKRITATVSLSKEVPPVSLSEWRSPPEEAP